MLSVLFFVCFAHPTALFLFMDGISKLSSLIYVFGVYVSCKIFSCTPFWCGVTVGKLCLTILRHTNLITPFRNKFDSTLGIQSDLHPSPHLNRFGHHASGKPA